MSMFVIIKLAGDAATSWSNTPSFVTKKKAGNCLVVALKTSAGFTLADDETQSQTAVTSSAAVSSPPPPPSLDMTVRS